MLIVLDNAIFRGLVPWLLVIATTLFASGPMLSYLRRHNGSPPRPRVLGYLAQFATAVYGGFFGAGMGFIMLACLGLTRDGGFHRLNALKNILSTVIALAAVAVFVISGVVSWSDAAILIPGVAAGGYLGVYYSKHVSESVIRILVICIGVGLTVYYFIE